MFDLWDADMSAEQSAGGEGEEVVEGEGECGGLGVVVGGGAVDVRVGVDDVWGDFVVKIRAVWPGDGGGLDLRLGYGF